MRNSVLKKVLFFLMYLIMIVILLEIFFNVYIYYFATNKQIEEYASIRQLIRMMNKKPERFRITPHSYAVYQNTPYYETSNDKHNSWGLRGEELGSKEEGEIWIACIGESTTYDSYVSSWEKSYPLQLEKYLREQNIRAKVLNAGVNGWTSSEILINYELELIRLPIDFVIYYGGLNDMSLTRFVYPVPDNYSNVKISNIRGGIDIMLGYPVWENISLLRIIGIRIFDLKPHYDMFYQRTKGNNLTEEFLIQLIRGKYPSGIFKELSPEEIIKKNPPLWFENNIRNIIYISKGRKITPILISYILYNSRDYCESSTLKLQPAIDIFLDFLSNLVNEMNMHLERIAKEEGVYFYDLASIYPRKPEYFFDFIHNSDEGAKLKAKFIGNFIIDHVLKR